LSSDGFNVLIVTAHSYVLSHFGSWGGSESNYGKVKRAEAYMVAHLMEVASQENPPTDQKTINATSTRWLQMYQNICLEVAGKNPFQSAAGYGMTGLGGGGSFNTSFKTITPDEDSYTASTTR